MTVPYTFADQAGPIPLSELDDNFAAEDAALATHISDTTTHGTTGNVVGTSDTQILTNKTVSLASNTISGTKAQFNTALSDDDFAYLGAQNTFNQPQVIEASSATTALRVVQAGAGYALVVEDETNPDATPFVIDAAGRVGIGVAPPANSLLYMVKGLSGATTAFASRAQVDVQSDVTGLAIGYSSVLSTQPAAFSLGTLQHFRIDQGTLGAGSSIGTQMGYYCSDLTMATVNEAFRGEVSAGANKYNLRMLGSADNVFTGNVLVNGAAGGIGYGAGAGGAVTQITSKSTAVTLDRPTGKITTHNAALAAGASVNFTLANSTIGADDIIVGGLTSFAGSYALSFEVSVAGSCFVHLRNLTAGSLSDALVIKFAIIKSTAA